MFRYEKLTVWRLAKDFAVEICRLTANFPQREMYGLCSQMNRAAVSIPSNIAEGSSRQSDKDQVRFVEIAYGSLMEVTCQLEICRDLEYISLQDYERILNLAKDLSVRLNNFAATLKSSQH